MTSNRLSASDEQAFALLGAMLTGLLSSGGRTLPQKLEVLRRAEVIRRQWATLDHALINAFDPVEVRSLGAADVAAVLVRELRITPGEAKARVRAAADLGSRVTSAGEVVGPVFAPVAAAQASGVISVEHAAVIRRTIGDLPTAVEAEHGDRLQAQLVERAGLMNPNDLAKAAARAAMALDPSAGLSDTEIEARRDASLVQRRDGMFVLSGVLTPECGAAWQPVFDSLAAPAPASGGVRDPRTPGQRRHDALRDIPLLLMRAEALPECGGLVATMHLTMTAEQAETGQGYATTSRGDLVPVRRLLGLALDSQVLAVKLDPTGGIMSYGRTRRLAPKGMRRALFARDGGCSFPDCDRPPEWTEAHHCIPWNEGGLTSIDNLTLACGLHHREYASDTGGWRAVMINELPHWVPPASVDPTRTPRRNTRHSQRRAA